MGGIAGCTGSRREAVATMLRAMTHRGPDGSGLTTHNGIVIGRDRLAVTDLHAGSQPLANEDNSLRLAFDGDIYNAGPLRRDLEAAGHRFATRTDCEVIVHLYEDEGPACIEKLDGNFAFALATPDGLLLARDPLGARPLYIGFDAGGDLYFASEIHALLPHVETIEAFPPGHYWTPGAGFVRYHRLSPVTEDFEDVDRAVRVLTERLQKAVRTRLAADVPVGVMLSGGLDSSLVAAMAVEACREADLEDLHSFAVGMDDSEDLEQARLVADHLGTVHHELRFSRDDLLRLLPRVVARLESYDPALVRGALATYLAAALARRHVKVVLSGEGADELFGGYHYLKRPDVLPRLQEELREITLSLHNTGLQRVDRMSMSHSLVVRVPFLAPDLERVAWRVPAEWKIHPSGTEKWILRQVAEDYLPPAVTDREKAKFAIGTGVGPVLEAYAEEVISDDEFQREMGRLGDLGVRTKEALLYYRWFERTFGPRTREAARLVGLSRSLNPGEIYAGAASRGA